MGNTGPKLLNGEQGNEYYDALLPTNNETGSLFQLKFVFQTTLQKEIFQITAAQIREYY